MDHGRRPDRAVASFDGGGPRALGRFSSRFGTPVAMNLLSGIVATVLMVAAFKITGGDASRYFSAVLGLTISTTHDLVRARLPGADQAAVFPARGPAPLPGSLGHRGCLALLAGANLLGAAGDRRADLARFGVGWFLTGGNPNDDLASLSFSHQRMAYELSQIVPLAVIIVIGVIFYALGRTTRQDVATEPVTAAYGPADPS